MDPTTLELTTARTVLRANGSTLVKPGYMAVTLSLKATAVAPGDVSTDDLFAIADLADRFSFGEPVYLSAVVAAAMSPPPDLDWDEMALDDPEAFTDDDSQQQNAELLPRAPHAALSRSNSRNALARNRVCRTRRSAPRSGRSAC